MVEFEVDPKMDFILVRTEGSFNSKYAYDNQLTDLEYSLKISSSEVNYLAPGELTRAIVSDSEDRFRVFEFFVNKKQFPSDGSNDEPVDLFIEMTPCTGLLKLFISDDYNNLFSKKSEMKSESAGTFTSLQLKNKV